MGPTTALRREIKHRFIPHVVASGFTLDEREAPTFWLFRRQAGPSAQLFSIQWEKYGRPRFRLDFGTCPIEGLDFTGKHVEWSSMHPHWLPDAASLKPGRAIFSRSWFRQDRTPILQLFGATALRPAKEVVDELFSLYPEVEAYWASGKVGKHIQQWSRR